MNLMKSKKISATVLHSPGFHRLNATKTQSKVSNISIAKILAPVRLATQRELNVDCSVISARPLVVSKVVELV